MRKGARRAAFLFVQDVLGACLVSPGPKSVRLKGQFRALERP